MTAYDQLVNRLVAAGAAPKEVKAQLRRLSRVIQLHDDPHRALADPAVRRTVTPGEMATVLRRSAANEELRDPIEVLDSLAKDLNGHLRELCIELVEWRLPLGSRHLTGVFRFTSSGLHKRILGTFVEMEAPRELHEALNHACGVTLGSAVFLPRRRKGLNTPLHLVRAARVSGY